LLKFGKLAQSSIIISTAAKFHRSLVGAVSFRVTTAPTGTIGGKVSFCTQYLSPVEVSSHWLSRIRLMPDRARDGVVPMVVAPIRLDSQQLRLIKVTPHRHALSSSIKAIRLKTITLLP
jgi:hypothetical protein